MLKLSPDVELEVAAPPDDDTIFCANCGVPVTRRGWAITIAGAHRHSFVNPAGIAFEIGCFRHAPGAGAVGPYVGEATWFAGTEWAVAVCHDCRSHLGWRYRGEGGPFHGLIVDRLDFEGSRAATPE